MHMEGTIMGLLGESIITFAVLYGLLAVILVVVFILVGCRSGWRSPS